MEEEKCRLHVVLDNIRSAFNVGSIFRTADAVGGVKLYLCGMTATPDNVKVPKTSLGAEKTVPFQYYSNTLQAIEEIKTLRIPVYAVEITEKSQHFQKIIYPSPVALVFGHEKNGVNQLVLDQSDEIIYIPMGGVKESLNVATTAGIIMYEAVRDCSVV